MCLQDFIFFGVFFFKRAGFRASVPSSSSFLLAAATSWSSHQQQLWWTDVFKSVAKWQVHFILI